MGRLGSLVQQAGVPEQTANQVGLLLSGLACSEPRTKGCGEEHGPQAGLHCAARPTVRRAVRRFGAVVCITCGSALHSCVQLTGLAKLGMGIAGTIAQTVGSASAPEDIDALAGVLVRLSFTAPCWSSAL